MPGTHGALRVIEWTAASLCRALSGSADLLEQALSTVPASEAAVHDAAKALIKQVYLRQAAAGPIDDAISLPRIAALAHGLPNQVVVDLSALPPTTEFPASLGHIILNVLLMAANSLPRGGQIALAGAVDDLFIRIAGPSAAWPIGMALCLVNPAEANGALTDGRDFQMALTTSLAHASGIRFSALFTPGGQTEPAILRLGG